MAVTSGFFNSQNHDRLYDAIQISSMFDGLILDGVYQKYGDAFLVTPYSDADNTVIIGTGRGWFDHTWILNDTQFTIEIDAPNGMLSRIDAIVLDINREDSVRKNDILYIPGTFSDGTASKPALINEEMHKQYPIAYIDVPAGDSAPISSANIELTVGTDECPLVEAVMDVMDLDMFVNQMQGKFYEWFDKLQDVMDSNTALKLQHQIDDLEVYVDSQDQKYMNSTRNYENIPRKDCYRTLTLDGGSFLSNDYTSINPYIDSSGNTHLLYVTKNSDTSVYYKYAKITKDGVITVQDLSTESKKSNSANIWFCSQFCKDSDGILYGMLIGGSGTNGYSAPLKIYKFSDTVEEIYTDSTITGFNFTTPAGYSAFRPMLFGYNEYYDIFIIANSISSSGMAYYYFTSDFTIVKQSKTLYINDIFYKYAITNTKSGSINATSNKEDLNPDSWTSYSTSDFGEYVAPYVHSSNETFIPITSKIADSLSNTIISFGIIKKGKDYSDLTRVGVFSHYIAANTCYSGDLERPDSSYARNECDSPYCYNYSKSRVYATTAKTYLTGDTTERSNFIPAVLLFNSETFQSGIIIPDSTFSFADAENTSYPFNSDFVRPFCAMTDDGYYSSSFSTYNSRYTLIQLNVEFTAPSIES